MPIDPSIPLQGRPANVPGPLEMYSQLLGLKSQQQQMDLQQQSQQALAGERQARTASDQAQAQAAQRRQQMESTVDTIMQKSMTEPDENGVSTFDRKAAEQSMIQQGLGHLYPQYAETFDKLDRSTEALNQQRGKVFAEAILGVQRHGNTPESALGAVAYLKKNKVLGDADAQGVIDGISADPTPAHIDQLMSAAGARIPQYAELAAADEKRQSDLAKSQAETRKANAEATNLETYGRSTAPEPTKPGSFEDYTVRFAKQMGKSPDALTPADIEKARKQYQQADDKTAVDDAAVTLTQAGLDAAAKRYAKDGSLPPMGMGKAGAVVRSKVINRASELFPDLDIAANKADYKADSGALTQLQKQRDAIGAFEQTAGKNIDVFLKSAGKVVDTGSPMANSVARMISGKMLGSEDQAAYDASRQVAINEIAKITSNPNLSGSLSDSARHEVEAFNPQSATLKQTVAVMRLLKTDMANRTSAMDEQLKTIKGRIKGTSDGSGDQQAPAATPAGPFSYADYLKAKGK